MYTEKSIFYFLVEPHSMWDLISPTMGLNQGLNPCPLQWKLRVLNTGPTGKS